MQARRRVGPPRLVDWLQTPLSILKAVKLSGPR